ncbi:hypothetical protein PHMEG_00019033 [Phytophthora megakarya]|uniref:Uncharacterized protein n=1 Tax=Phytophthora megakarya TaxID=4795 RepID=A0A225VSX7_9STRA|nr:hypothetical protein PHMEG_00019033 [Phytophthora megakarya]
MTRAARMASIALLDRRAHDTGVHLLVDEGPTSDVLCQKKLRGIRSAASRLRHTHTRHSPRPTKTAMVCMSATTFNLPGLYSTRKLYSAKKDNHLAIRCEICGDFTAVRNDAWSV